MNRRGLGELSGDLTRALREPGEGASARARGYGARGSTSRGSAVPARANIGIQNKKTVNGSTQMAPARADRSYLAIQNQSATLEIWYQFGVDAGLNAGFVIPPGGADIWEVVVPVGSIYVWCSAAGHSVGIAEGVAAGAELGYEGTAPEAAAAAPAAAAPAAYRGFLSLRRR